MGMIEEWGDCTLWVTTTYFRKQVLVADGDRLHFEMPTAKK